MPEASFNWNNPHMVRKKAASIEEQAAFAGDAELDQAIDDLRGVLKQDGAATDFGAEFGAAEPFGQGGDFGGGLGAGGFGGDFGDTSLDGSLDVGTGFAGSDFGGDGFGAVPSGIESAPGSGMAANMDLIMDIPIDVQIVLGTSRMQVSGLMGLTEGATIALDRRIGEPVEIMVNGRVIGRGEITVLEGDVTRFGVKLIEIKGSRK
ncbi:flagellar motor switch protein FliN [Sinorhizobium fredii USDA 205]|uniref:Flagellar motor switch protein FliN n=3 Tax=Rhizobium fredii TaxID=380 RepID=A0A844ADZ9_RHIFR|nr:flagellar motor switch protein FliN [Sinorhizobium fredii USDA 205]MQW95638.1 flagellar motor switch protein FliN [Sinorhizobium fredii]CCE94809.1 Flagellar motor switch protein FliN [Sinorhizobium fredii HH103]MQX10767.1 flagellar motor switch protein FliN [Sinorhizobium fredii]UTY48149.1 flagellar motor switch protein FliN [Sinorhizobium fredii]